MDSDEEELIVLPSHSSPSTFKTRDVFLNLSTSKSTSKFTSKQKSSTAASNNNAQPVHQPTTIAIDFNKLHFEATRQSHYHPSRAALSNAEASARVMLSQKLSEIKLSYKNELNNAAMSYESKLRKLEARGNAEASKAIERCEETISSSVEKLVREYEVRHYTGQEKFPRRPDFEREDKEYQSHQSQFESGISKQRAEEEAGRGQGIFGRVKKCVGGELDMDTTSNTNNSGGENIVSTPNNFHSTNWRNNRASVAAAVGLTPSKKLFENLESRISTIEKAVVQVDCEKSLDYRKFVKLGNSNDEDSYTTSTSYTSDEEEEGK